MANSTRHTATSQNPERSALAVACRLFAVGGRALAPLGAMLALGACGNIEPWVKPYEREALADPIMSFNAHPVSSAYSDHVFEAREGSRGALGGGGGGCGCN